MTNTPAELADLADIIETEQLPFAGIAAGWWLLATLLLVLLAVLGYWLYRQHKQKQLNQALVEARDALNRLNEKQPDAAQQINIILKRLVRHYRPDSPLLSCALPEWQEFLQQQQPTTLLPDLTALLYQAEPDPQQVAVFADFARSWLQHCDARQLTDRFREAANA